MTDRMGIHLLFLIPEKGEDEERKGEERREGERFLQRANCTINQETSSCLQWISHITDSFSGLGKLEAFEPSNNYTTHNEAAGP